MSERLTLHGTFEVVVPAGVDPAQLGGSTDVASHLQLFQPAVAATVHAPPPPVSVSDPAADPRDLPTLFAARLRPDLERRGRSTETIREYERFLVKWQGFWASPIASQKYRTTHPVLSLALGQIKREHLVAWQRYLLDCGDSPRNVNKQLGAVQRVLSFAVEEGLIEHAPKLSALPCRKAAAKFYLELAEIDRLYRACERATWPTVDRQRKPLPGGPAMQWRAAIVMWLNYGQRTQELVAYQRRMRSLTWGNVTWAHDTPSEEGKARCEFGWFWYLPEKQAWAKSQPLVLPLGEMPRRHLEAIRPRGKVLATSSGGQDGRPVFSWPLSNDAFYAQWRSLCEMAEIAPKPCLKTRAKRHYLVKHFRKTCETLHDLRRPGIGAVITGHAARDVSTRHYINQELAVLEAVLSFPQPVSFSAIR